MLRSAAFPLILAFLMVSCGSDPAEVGDEASSSKARGRKVEPQPAGPSTTSPPPANDLPYVEQPEGLDFDLFDTGRRRVRLSEFRGKVAVVSFFYRSCPDQMMCPALLSKLRQLAEDIPHSIKDDSPILAISFDPAHDTPENLAVFAEAKELPFKLLTGDPKAVAEVAKEKFGIQYEEREPALFDHNMKTFVIDPEGELVRTFDGSRWEPKDVVRAIKAALGE